MTSPLKWPVWLRISVVASVLWTGGVFAYNYDCYGNRCWLNIQDLLMGLIPLCLFWGGAWIFHGIKLRKKQGHQLKEPATIQTPSRTSDPPDCSQNGQYVPHGNETVMDTKTDLMWAAKDNGSDINWADAKLYCENYRVGGYGNWRMPTHGELAGLYGSVHLTKLIQLSDYFLWGLDTSGSTTAVNVYFTSGTLYWTLQSKSDRYRVLPVRNAKKIDTTVEDASKTASRKAAVDRLRQDMAAFVADAKAAGITLEAHLKANGFDDAAIARFIAVTKPEKQG